jgi:hypothetical protein
VVALRSEEGRWGLKKTKCFAYCMIVLHYLSGFTHVLLIVKMGLVQVALTQHFVVAPSSPLSSISGRMIQDRVHLFFKFIAFYYAVRSRFSSNITDVFTLICLQSYKERCYEYTVH